MAGLGTGTGRRRRGWLDRVLEVLGVGALAAGVTAWVWWPQVKGLSTTVPMNLGDPLYFAWQLAWVSHAVGGDGSLWTSNAFDGTPDSLAFTDTILGYAPLGLVAGGGQAGALTQLNLGGLFATWLAVMGAYALARALGAGVAGSLVAGAGFGFAPWRLEQVIHLNVVSTGGMALAMALLARGHGWSLARGYEPDRASPWWAGAGWAVACWQLSVSLAIGIPFGYVLAVAAVGAAIGWWRSRRPAVARRVLVADVGGGLALAVTAALLARPYLRVLQAYPEGARTADYLPLFSPPWRGLLTAPQTSRWWGERHAGLREGMGWVPEMVLLPGFVLIALAVVGLVVSSWPRRYRVVLAVAVAVAAVLALGTTVAGGRWTYLPLFEHLPGWQGLRTPGRLVIWVTLGLCLLAAGAVDALVRRARTGLRRDREVRLAPLAALMALTALAPALVVLEGRGEVPTWEVAPSPVALEDLTQPVLVLPTSQIADYHVQLWSTQGWPRLVNGGSGFEPTFQTRMREEAATFPSARAVAALRARGVASVVVVRSRAPGTPWEGAADRPAPPDVTRTDLGDAVVFDLR